MTRSYIEVFLPVFILGFTILFLFWNYKLHRSLILGYNIAEEVKPICQINGRFHILVGVAVLVIGIYSFLPEYYNLFIPIAVLDHPFINDVGLFILRIAFFWLISTIIHTYFLLRKIKKESPEEDPKSPQEVYTYVQKIVLIGVLLMLIGLFVTISSVFAFILSFAGLLNYQRFYPLETTK